MDTGFNVSVAARSREISGAAPTFSRPVEDWRFEVLEMKGGKTMMFVFAKTFEPHYCEGPNAFFVKRIKQEPIGETRAQVSDRR